MADHCSNLAVAMIELESDSFDTHEYLISLKKVRSHSFDQYYEDYRKKFSLPSVRPLALLPAPMVSSGQTLPWKGETLLWISPFTKRPWRPPASPSSGSPAQAAKEALVARFAGKTIGMGGSVTLRDLGLYEALSQRGTVYWHWQQPGPETLAQAAQAQVYLTSVNALAETGQLVNIDGTGNRISAAAGAHETVCYLVGRNKIAPTFQQALWRARNIAAPLNARRLHRKTPCAQGETLRCYDCRSPERICNGLSVLWRPLGGVGETLVCLVGEDLGY